VVGVRILGVGETMKVEGVVRALEKMERGDWEYHDPW
jgi:hypothetical protein